MSMNPTVLVYQKMPDGFYCMCSVLKRSSESFLLGNAVL